MAQQPGTQTTPVPQGPLISDSVIDVPTQRLYYLSFGLLCQAIKLYDFLNYVFMPTNTSTNYGVKWLIVDFCYCALLAQLRIPRLNYSKSIVLLQIASLWFLDGLLFGGIELHLAGILSASGNRDLYSVSEPFRLLDVLGYVGLGFLIPGRASIGGDAHLLGQHTVRMSPISTAQLNPDQFTLCLSETVPSVLVPILLNNTDPVHIKYSLTPLGLRQGSIASEKTQKAIGGVEYHELSKKDLRVMRQALEEGARTARPIGQGQQDRQEYDEYDDEEHPDRRHQAQSLLQKTQSLFYVKLNKPGIFRLERVVDASNTDAKLLYPKEMVVVPCPRVEFTDDRLMLPENQFFCHGHDRELDLTIDIHGVPPLTLRWFKEINDRREHFVVEGIEGNEDQSPPSDPDLNRDAVRRSRAAPQDIKVPLSVPLDTLGAHLYALQEVMDGMGNLVRIPDALQLDSGTANNTKTARSLIVLRRPSFSFQGCSPENPTPLLIGSDAPLKLSANVADPLDGPWELLMKYVPGVATEENAKATTKLAKPWKRTARTEPGKFDLIVRANTPGMYTLISVKGKWCEGDVLAPETCKVFERPKPTANIEWKRIHECSGDTGVSASLIFHGTPPFTVHYRMQRNKDTAKELTKTFASSRGELALQPPHSGHYTYTFTHLSDAYYKAVPLDGPSIDQAVHPLASAVILGVESQGKRRMINSCSGDVVDVEVEFFGKGPWNLELQVVGAKSSEILHFPGISTPRKTLKIPIPVEVAKDGGTFEVVLASVEDANGCKRTLTAPGIIVNVRRVKPSARFYGSEDKRRIAVLAGDRAQLPLRLTGDGPWRISYSFTLSEGKARPLTITVSSPNGYLDVTEAGLYELTSVVDSQCPGTVLPEAATFRVEWVPKPSIKLSPRSGATLDQYTNSYILPAVCEGVDDSVDLELTGRPPFQITYDVVKRDGMGGTELLDESTFSSIQPRSRFQLQTSSPGQVLYEVKQIGDAAYPLNTRGAVLSPSNRLVFEQQVLLRPTARFNTGLTDGLVILEGSPPFSLKLSIKSLSSSDLQTRVVQVNERSWKLDVPSYIFSSIGPHVVKIEAVQDAHGCVQGTVDFAVQQLWVDVAETAAIIPLDSRKDLCVGDASQFQLEGLPPWTVGYRINGKPYVQEAKTSPFSVLQQHPGEFVITHVSHQQKMCQANVMDQRFVIHALPSARVGQGKRIYQDIHEGDQAEIVFSLHGEPPFTFTYQRSEPPSQPGGRPGKALETHTVSGVTTNEYSIYSALEGTWTVVSIADRHCRYPPLHSDAPHH